MNPPPLPTPYDIVDIPYFPYVPGIVAWALSLAAAGVIVLLLRRASSSRTKLQTRAYELALRQLGSAEQTAAERPKDGFAVASLIAKRFVSSCERDDLLALSAGELERYVEACPGRELRQLLETVVELDTYRYQRAGAALPGREIIGVLRERLSAYHNVALRRER